jgi:hypothetical protein
MGEGRRKKEECDVKRYFVGGVTVPLITCGFTRGIGFW